MVKTKMFRPGEQHMLHCAECGHSVSDHAAMGVCPLKTSEPVKKVTYLAFSTIAELAYHIEKKLTADEILELTRRAQNFQKVRERQKVTGAEPFKK